MFRLSLLLLLLLPLGADAQTKKKYALLVGVNKYEHRDMNQPEPLKYAEADMNEMEKLLKKSGYDVDSLIGEKATRASIAKKVAELSTKGNSDGVVLVALSGHGIQLEQDDEAYYCPYDTKMRDAIRGGQKLKDNRGNVLREPDPASLIKLTDIVVAFKLSPAGSRALLADCCRNDPTSGRSPRAVGSGIRPDQLPDNTAVILSCSQGQRAWEDKKWGHGAFFYHVLGGLRQGKSTATGLTDYLEQNVPKDVKATVRDAPDQKPRPLINGSMDLGIVATEAAKTSTTGVPGGGTTPGTKPMDLSSPKDLLKLDSTQRPVAPTDAKKIQAEWAKSLDLELPVKVSAGGRPMEFTLIPPGSFLMGSQRRVNFTRPFLMSVCEVKQAEYFSLMQTNPSHFQRVPNGPQKLNVLVNVKSTDDFPVEDVKWDQTQDFSRKLKSVCKNQLSKLKISDVRLPTEAEWEYAARAATNSPFQNGQDLLLATDANFGPLSRRRTMECGTFTPNALGLRDIHGNVAEWCQDWYKSDLDTSEISDPVPIPARPGDTSAEYVVVGGSWQDGADNCMFGRRMGVSKKFHEETIGFRVVIILEVTK